MRSRTKLVFLILTAIALGLASVFALPALNPTLENIQSAPVPQNERDMRLYDFLSEQMRHGLPISGIDKEYYLSLESQFASDRDSRNSLDNQGGPDAFQYRYMDNVAPDTVSYNWIELRGDGEATWLPGSAYGWPTSWPADDGVSLRKLPIGFSFPFYGANYDCVHVCTNGFLQFTTTSVSPSNACLPSTAVAGPMIAMLWDDLHMLRGGRTDTVVIGYKNFGTHFVVQFDQMGFYSTSCPNVPLKFQAILYPSGNIKLQYNTLNIPTACANTQTIGIQQAGTAGSAALNYVCNTTGIQPANGRAILFYRPAGIPNSCTNLVGNYTAPNVVLTWTDPTQDTQGNPITVTNVQVWLGAAVTGTLLNTVNAGVQTYTHLNAPIGSNIYTVRPYLTPNYGSATSTTVIVGTPGYSNDFEIDNGNWVADPATGGWEWGTPTYASGPTSAHSGTKVWGTVLAGTYALDACYKLTLSPNLAVQSPTASVEFWAWYATEGNSTPYDGCNFTVSTDNGTTWQPVNPTPAYDDASTDEGNACIPGEPSWNGTTAGNFWHLVTIPIGQFIGQTPMFRFSFGSDFLVNYAGFYLDDVVIWGLTLPQTTNVSGTVTLDGIGTMTSVTISANGIGNPTTHPAANGTYTLSGVQTGSRTLIASLTGFVSDTNIVTVPTGGLTNENFVLRRVAPPAPTGLTGTVNSATGVVSLNWDDSPDLLVDQYKIYRKTRQDANWTFRRTINGRTNSQGADTLTAGGIYQFHVTAVDTNVLAPPIESGQSNTLELNYGALPPHSLAADTAYDNKIRLSWLDPLALPETELFYDNGVECVGGIGWPGTPTFGWMVSKFQRPGPTRVLRVKLYFADGATVGSPMQVGVFADSTTGRPTFTPLGVTNITMPATLDAWHEFTLSTPITIPGNTFYVGVRQMGTGIPTLSLGGDTTAPFLTNTFMYCYSLANGWVLFEPGLPLVPMLRCIVSSGGAAVALEPGEMFDSEIASEIPNSIPGNFGAWPVGAAFEERLSSAKRAGEKTAAVSDRMSSRSPLPRSVIERGRYAVEHPPRMTSVSPERSRSTLDDVVRYLIYRNSVRFDSVLAAVRQYDNVVGSTNENVAYTYYVTARYDNGQESPASNSVTARCGMPPAAPTNFTLTRVGSTQIRLQWTDPSLNADGTPCTDLAGIRVYRDGVLRTTVTVGTQQYLDGPLTPSQSYTWELRAVDEVPNVSSGVSRSTVAGSPSYENSFDSNNGQWVATPATGGWQWGPPTFASGPQPYSSPNCWGTVLSGEYIDGACWQLDLNLGLTVQSTSAMVEFYAWWMTEESYDGCNFKVSTNSGSSWTVVNPNGGYPDTSLDGTWNTCGMGGQGAWSGSGNTWQHVVIPIGQFVGNVPIFRFEFSSDTLSATDAGFYFDDMLIWGMQPPSGIEGTVRTTTSQAISNARVWAVGQPDTVRTDAAGRYSLSVSPGTYSVTFDHIHYCDTTYAGVVVTEGSQTTRDAVLRAPNGHVDATSLSIQTSLGVSVMDTFVISNTNGQCPLDFTVTDTSAWITVNPTGGTVNPNQTVEVVVTVNPTGLSVGDYSSNIRVFYNSTGSPHTVRVDLHVGMAANEQHLIPTEFAYYQNFPNPFNARTSLQFDVPQLSRVAITIYNIMGQEVAHPVDNIYAPGRYSVLYDAGNLPSGMYLVKMSAGSYATTSKMMLLK